MEELKFVGYEEKKDTGISINFIIFSSIVGLSIIVVMLSTYLLIL